MLVSKLISLIEHIANPGHAADWDQSGTQIGGTKNEINKLAVSLDPTPETISQALDWNADFILTHHPLGLAPRLPSKNDTYTTVLRQVLSSGSWLYAAHTSLDTQTRGPVSWLAAALDLGAVRPIDPLPRRRFVKITLAGLDPDPELLLALDRQKSEVRYAISNDCLQIVAPKEETEPVFTMLQRFVLDRPAELTELISLQQRQGYGVMGELSPPLSWSGLQAKLAAILQTDHLHMIGQVPDRVSKVAYCPGSGMSLAAKGFASGAEVFISGDLKFHQAQAIEGLGLTVDVGHFALEERMMSAFSKELKSTLDKEVLVRFIPGQDPFRIFR